MVGRLVGSKLVGRSGGCVETDWSLGTLCLFREFVVGLVLFAMSIRARIAMHYIMLKSNICQGTPTLSEDQVLQLVWDAFKASKTTTAPKIERPQNYE